MEALSAKDASLIRLVLAASWHQWQFLPRLAQECYDDTCSIAEMRGCLRHLIILAGYAPTLAATKHLYNAQLLPEDVPGKCGGPPGDAFELVYGNVSPAMHTALREIDPVLADWIRRHLFGDIYSSPGLDMQQKQLLTIAFLAQADMQDELSMHAIAGMRFGLTLRACRQAVDLSFQWKQRILRNVSDQDVQPVQQRAQGALQKAHDRYQRHHAGEHEMPEVSIPDSLSVGLPPLPPMSNHNQHR